jgi:hypothetical protein
LQELIDKKLYGSLPTIPRWQLVLNSLQVLILRLLSSTMKSLLNLLKLWMQITKFQADKLWEIL